MKKMLKRSLAILLCLTMIFNYSFSVLADENVESSEPETTYTETIETTESNEITETPKTTESIEESESEEESLVESSENIEEPEEIEESDEDSEDTEDVYEEEPEEDSEELVNEPKVEDITEEIEEADISSPSEITDEENEENSIPEDMVEEPEEDELVEDIEGVEELSLLGSIASPSEIEENEEVETEEEVEEATPSELEMPMLLGAPLFGDPAPTDHCKIGSTGYATLEAAISAVTNGQTITMLQDVTYGTPLTINNGKTFTIDFDDSSSTHTFKWDVTVGQAYQQDIIIIEGNSNVTVKNMEFLIGTHDEHGNRIFKVNSTGKLTLNNMTLNSGDSIKNTPVQNNGGTVVIDGGNITTNESTNGSIPVNEKHNPIVQNLGGTTTFKGNGTYTMQNNSTGAAWLGRVITLPAQSTDADRDSECGTVIIENGTFNTGQIIVVNGKGTITINDATYGTGNGPIIKAFHGGIKSNITINNITTSAMVFAQVIEELQTKINFQNGNVKYTPTRFCINQTGTATMTSVSIKNGKFGPKTGSADIHDEINNLLASGATLTALTGDPDGYTYKVETSTPTPPPTPIPPYGGGSSGGGGGGGAGIPKYDLEGNIISPTGIQNYGYDGTNPPNLSGNINVSYWDYSIGGAKTINIHYVQNIDSFVKSDNTPVATEWVGVSMENASKLVWYRTNASGQILRNQFIQIGNNIYYLDNNGIMVTGQYTINGKVYNFETAVGATEGRFLY